MDISISSIYFKIRVRLLLTIYYVGLVCSDFVGNEYILHRLLVFRVIVVEQVGSSENFLIPGSRSID